MKKISYENYLKKYAKEAIIRRTIEIRKETRERLKSLGKKGETYDTIIIRLIEGRVKDEDRI